MNWVKNIIILKNQNFGNTRGCKKSYVWNQGLTKKQQVEYQYLRNNKLFCLLSEKPKKGMLFLPIIQYECKWCKKIIFSKTKRSFCSNKCSAQYSALLSRGKPRKKGRTAWNKGVPNPHSAELGRKSAAKLSATVKGRKIAYREDGTRYWTYPNNPPSSQN